VVDVEQDDAQDQRGVEEMTIKITIPDDIPAESVRLYAILPNGEEFLVDDLYWFEEDHVHDWSGDSAFRGKFKFRFEFGGKDVRNRPS
jgi:hypothetical protein